jgi:hypothetical protein
MTPLNLTEVLFVHVGTVAEELYELMTLDVEISLVVLAAGVRDRRHSYTAAILHAEEPGQFDILIDQGYSRKEWFAKRGMS